MSVNNSDYDLSIINIGKLNPSIIKLISTAEKAIGGIFKPMQIRRVAKAKADALLIAAEADAKKQELAYRAAQRISHLEIKRQENLENIIKEAVKVIPPKISNEPVDPDWIAFFFDECKDIGNQDVQKLWGKLLAGEFEKPGTFSRKALSILKTMSSADTKHFEEMVSMIFIIDNEPGVLVPGRTTCRPRELSRQLDPVGLVMIGFDILRKDVVHSNLKQYKLINDYHEPPMVAVKRFTPAGIELARLAKANPDAVITELNEAFRGDFVTITELV